MPPLSAYRAPSRGSICALIDSSKVNTSRASSDSASRSGWSSEDESQSCRPPCVVTSAVTDKSGRSRLSICLARPSGTRLKRGQYKDSKQVKRETRHITLCEPCPQAEVPSLDDPPRYTVLCVTCVLIPQFKLLRRCPQGLMIKRVLDLPLSPPE